MRCVLPPVRCVLLRRPFSTESFSTESATSIRNTIHRFFHVMDGLEPETRLSDLFLEDATLHVQKANLVLDAAEVDGWVAKLQAGWVGNPTLHTEGNIVMQEPEPGLVVSHSTWTALVGGNLAAYGTHADILKQVLSNDGENHQWKFQRRVVRHLYSAP